MEHKAPEEFQHKFRSKQDLYAILTIDLHYHLPPYDCCPISFLRDIFRGVKKALRQKEVLEIKVPRFKELSVKNMWPLIYVVDDLNMYFPNLKPNQLPDRDYMFSILSTLRTEELISCIENARKQRSLSQDNKEEGLIFIKKELYEELENVCIQKTSKGRANFLLRKCAKLDTIRKKPREYELSFLNLNEEEKNHEEDENDMG